MVVEATDRLGVVVVDVGVDHRTAPQRVVDADQTVGREPGEELFVVVDVAALVGVDEREVDDGVGRQRAQRLDRGRDPQLDAVVDAGERPVLACDVGPLGTDVAAQQASPSDRPLAIDSEE